MLETPTYNAFTETEWREILKAVNYVLLMNAAKDIIEHKALERVSLKLQAFGYGKVRVGE